MADLPGGTVTFFFTDIEGAPIHRWFPASPRRQDRTLAPYLKAQ